IQQITLKDLPEDRGGFTYATRFDRCTTCHLGIERGNFDKESIRALNSVPEGLQAKLKQAKAFIKERVDAGESLDYDPSDLPRTARTLKLTSGQITQYCAHPRLDLFVDANSPHPVEKFGCTSCHAGQGSATEFTFASHTPNTMRQKDEWIRD